MEITMNNLGRNQPCHCGSGKKYKKCCLRKDEDTRREEQDVQEFDYALRHGLIDPLASDEDWQEKSEPVWSEDYFAKASEDEPEFDDWYDDELEDDTEILSGNLLYEEQKEHLSEADVEHIESWWDIFENTIQPQELAAHVSRFMDEHPSLVKDLGLEVEPMYRLEYNCIERTDYLQYLDIITRLKEEFPDAYKIGFPGYDKFMVWWQLIEGDKEHVAEYLERFRECPDEDPEALFEVVTLLASSNCQDILADFLPDIIEDVEKSPFLMESEDILHQAITLILAPFLDKGLQVFQVRELVEKLEPLKDLLASSWLDEETLQRKVERLLGVEGNWRLEECTTYLEAVELYNDVTSSFMGWLHRNKGMDWTTAGHFSLYLRSYLYEALPAEKKPVALFPIQGPDIAIMFQRLEGQYYFTNNTDMFSMLNAIYWFTEFFAELHLLEPEQVDTSQEICRKIFNLILKDVSQIDMDAKLWKTFPRIY